jgi:hypothetical protein
MTKLGVADRGAGDGGRPALEMLRLAPRRVQIEAPPQAPASCGPALRAGSGGGRSVPRQERREEGEDGRELVAGGHRRIRLAPPW